jgi:hypothetical protein
MSKFIEGRGRLLVAFFREPDLSYVLRKKRALYLLDMTAEL